jgi:hypothetical protein
LYNNNSLLPRQEGHRSPVGSLDNFCWRINTTENYNNIYNCKDILQSIKMVWPPIVRCSYKLSKKVTQFVKKLL